MSERATYHGDCADNGETLYWTWTGTPTDDREPGLDGYYVEVIDTVTREPVFIGVGAEDNAHGEWYSIRSIPGRDYYIRLVNDAAAFHYETDVIVSCPPPRPEPIIYDPTPEPTPDGFFTLLLAGAAMFLRLGLWFT